MAESSNTRPETEEWPVTKRSMALMHERLAELEARVDRLEEKVAELTAYSEPEWREISEQLKRLNARLERREDAGV